MFSKVAVTKGRVTVQGNQLEQQHTLDKAKGYGWELTDVILQTMKHSLCV